MEKPEHKNEQLDTFAMAFVVFGIVFCIEQEYLIFKIFT